MKYEKLHPMWSIAAEVLSSGEYWTSCRLLIFLSCTQQCVILFKLERKEYFFLIEWLYSSNSSKASAFLDAGFEWFCLFFLFEILVILPTPLCRTCGLHDAYSYTHYRSWERYSPFQPLKLEVIQLELLNICEESQSRLYLGVTFADSDCNVEID